jgi:predicted transcriptional regulator
MSTTTRRTVVTARIQSHHVEQLRQLAEERDTTISRLIARAVADQLSNAQRQEPAR